MAEISALVEVKPPVPGSLMLSSQMDKGRAEKGVVACSSPALTLCGRECNTRLALALYACERRAHLYLWRCMDVCAAETLFGC